MNLLNCGKCGKFVLLFAPLFVAFVMINGNTPINVPIHNDMLLYMLCALYGTFMVLFVSKYKLGKIIEYVGKRSLLIFCVHTIWITFFAMCVNNLCGTSYEFGHDMPTIFIIIGGIFVIMASTLTAWVMFPIYNAICHKIYCLIVSDNSEKVLK